MTLCEALAAFLAQRCPAPESSTPNAPATLTNALTEEARKDTQGKEIQSDASPRTTQAAFASSLAYLVGQFPNLTLNELSPAMVRDFLARRYAEEASAQAIRAGDAAPMANINMANAIADTSTHLPDAATLIQALSDFFHWAGAFCDAAINQERLRVLGDLRESLPRAIEISMALSRYVAERGGAIAFPEFLTSFEEGGRSEYDVGGAAGEVGAMEGYFRVLCVEGSAMTGEELIQEAQISSIVLSEEVVRLLDRDYILNLEIVRTQHGWQVTSCGFAYPPGTELLE